MILLQRRITRRLRRNSHAALQNNACKSPRDPLAFALQQGGFGCLSAFLDVSSLNLAALQGAATFLPPPS
jgi:hypothetical protein